ncbi:MAG TPA: 2-oxoglutarate dehydrogenase E1 component [Verrucomicrobiae bacterium]|nr:2-oxoglutarate dehydrogenase E1 component [Verrucomicrobiae bacterium]
MLENLGYLETIYSRYRLDPESVAPEWRDYFHGNGFANGHENGETALLSPSVIQPAARSANPDEKLHMLVRNFRVRGHRIAAIDPLGSTRPRPQELNLNFYNFAEAELNQPVHLPTLHFGAPLTIREIFDRLQNTYSRSIGAQFMHIDDWRPREWLQQRMESTQNRLSLSREEQLRILTRLTDAVIFEEFLRKKFLGAKTFSLEGCETLLPLLDLALERAGAQGVRDVVIGMAHRGRLNVLAHIAGKNPCDIFREFADATPEKWEGRGDVKYHLGYSGNWTTANGREIHVSLCFNPSHLEFINPVALGRTRARQDRCGDGDRRDILSLLIHGDAAFAGEGIVQESLNLSKLPGYSVGGTLHVILNNQIGFTTLPHESRSTPYATDIARMMQAPIFHVNGEDPEAVAQVIRLALDYRHEFQGDVFIDMYGYRRWGHNETDEPSFTQPVLYRQIEKRRNIQENYFEHLERLHGITKEDAEKIAAECREKLEKDLAAARSDNCPLPEKERNIWRGYAGGTEPREEMETGISPEKISGLLHKLSEVPGSFHLHPKLERGLKTRREMAEGEHPLDWAAAELLALASLADEGYRIRLTGQDSARGTFSHRHAIFYDHENGTPFCPLQHLSEKQAPVEIVNSPLCEAGALGFEYGYSLDWPDGLVFWEAQFGDFVNAAQVILDQFISSAEDKWNRLSGLVLLLPHGFEGMGAEHSSARLERFLTLAAEDNIQVAQPTTPAQYFHLLRRQALRKWRKPLVVLTPKSLLRHPKVVSSADEFAQGKFQRILPDNLPAETVKRVLICSGKIYYELLAYRDEQKRDDVAILRLEQFYPLRDELLENALEPYAENIPVLWVQDEPRNMGAWRFLHEKFGKHLFGRWPLALISRDESATPATGSSGAHKLEQARLIRRAFGDGENAKEPAPKKTSTSAKAQEE